MEIKRVATTDSQRAEYILKEMAEWLHERESTQWADVLQGTDRHGLAAAVKNGDVYYYYDKEQLVGMFAAWKNPSAWDRLLWRDQIEFSDAYYIHRIIIRPNHKGKGYGDQLLTDIKSYFKNEAGVLRLDCLANNEKLVSFYSKNKFEKVVTRKNDQGELFELFSFNLG